MLEISKRVFFFTLGCDIFEFLDLVEFIIQSLKKKKTAYLLHHKFRNYINFAIFLRIFKEIFCYLIKIYAYVVL